MIDCECIEIKIEKRFFEKILKEYKLVGVISPSIYCFNVCFI